MDQTFYDACLDPAIIARPKRNQATVLIPDRERRPEARRSDTSTIVRNFNGKNRRRNSSLPVRRRKYAAKPLT